MAGVVRRYRALIWEPLRPWLERAYPKLTYYNTLEKVATSPELFATELRAAFKSLR